MDDMYLDRIKGYLKELKRCAYEDCDFYLDHNDAVEFWDYLTNLLEYQAVIDMDWDDLDEMEEYE